MPAPPLQQYNPSPTTSWRNFGYRYVRAASLAAAISLVMLAVCSAFYETEDVAKASLATAEVTEDGVVVTAACKETYGVFPCSDSLYGSLFLVGIYGAIITLAAQCIGDGGEALLELGVLPPSVIGGILLPVLGVIPDAAIISVSCLGVSGDANQITRKIAVGMGTLAGSTIMLLTLAFAGSLWLGRCDLDEKGRAQDGILDGIPFQKGEPDSIGSICRHSVSTGISHDKGVLRIKWWMVLTSVCYLIAQVPAGIYQDPSKTRLGCMVGSICCGAFVVLYLIDSTMHGDSSEEGQHTAASKVEAKREARSAEYLSTLAGMISTNAIGADDIKSTFEEAARTRKNSTRDLRMSLRRVSQSKSGLKGQTMDIVDPLGEVNRNALDNVFDVFDVDKSGFLDEVETEKFAKVVFMSNGEAQVPLAMASALKAAQKERGKGPKQSPGLCESGASQPVGTIDKDTFTELVAKFLEDEFTRELGEEEKTGPDVVEDEPPMGVSAALVTILFGAFIASLFSDAMVNAIDSFGKFSGIPNFVIGFVVCPLASNASETISSFQLASRKKIRNASVTFAQIYAACTMNNCMCLGIFFFIVWKKSLDWNYAAEVSSIVVVTWLVAFSTLCDTTIKTGVGWFCVALYPLSLVYVEVLHRYHIA